MLCKLHYNLFSQREFGPPVTEPGNLISVLANSFSRLALGEEILFHRPSDAREIHNVSGQELFGPFGKF